VIDGRPDRRVDLAGTFQRARRRVEKTDVRVRSRMRADNSGEGVGR
jgi:hypothetical protein